MREPLLIVISREEVESLDLEGPITTLNKLLEAPGYARNYRENVDISFFGYEDWQEEVFEIVEIRNYVYKLDEQFPYWLYFLSKEMHGLYALAMCYVPPFIKDEYKDKYQRENIADLLDKRWFPALNQIGDFVEMSEEENKEITKKSINYFLQP